MKVGVIVLGVLPAGVKQIIYKLYHRLTPVHNLYGLEVGKDKKTIQYHDLKPDSDSPYLSHSMLKLSVIPTPSLWEDIASKMDIAIVIGDAEAKKNWQETISGSEQIRSLFVPVSIYNNIKGSDWSLGYDTAINSITQNVLKVKDTIHSLKYDKPRLFGFSIDGNPSTNMLQDISLAVDGHFLATDYEEEEINQLCENIEKGFNASDTSSVLIYSVALKDVIQEQVIKKIQVDWKYTEIDEALCMGTNPTAIDRILANELVESILYWTENDHSTGQLIVQKDGVHFK